MAAIPTFRLVLNESFVTSSSPSEAGVRGGANEQMKKKENKELVDSPRASG